MLIDDLVAGRWVNPETGTRADIPFESIVIDRTLDGRESALVTPLELGARLAVVSDENTYEVMGRRVESALSDIARIDSVVLDHPHPDDDTVTRVQDLTRQADALIAVGSGSINDLCKYATFLDGRPYAVFATAASMNGYTSTTAAITEAGFKKSLPAHGARGVFMDLEVLAAAPPRLTRSGLGDSLCRTTAQVDWLMSRALLGTTYHETPFALQAADEGLMLERAAGLIEGDLEAMASLCRILTLCGLGACFTGTSHHGSMSEHMVSHYIDMFAGDRHPGTLHGHQVGIAAISMSRLQHKIFGAPAPPTVEPTVIDEDAVLQRFGATVGRNCLAEWRKKALDERDAAALNQRLGTLWPDLVTELREVMLPTETLVNALGACGGYFTAGEAEIPLDFYREAIVHAREIRNRFSVLDIAGDANLLEEFAVGER